MRNPRSIAHLKKLSAPAVLDRLPVEERIRLDYRNRDHVGRYMRVWADLLEEALAAGAPAVPPRVCDAA
jgi:hypothetical protein